MNRRTVGRIASAAAALTLGGVGYAALSRARNPYYSGSTSDHFDGRRFFVPGAEAGDRGIVDLARWQLAGGRQPWPSAFPSPFADHPPERSTSLRVTLVGHATLLLQVAGLNILTDPIWSDRASPLSRLGPRRVNPPGIAFDDLPPIDIVLVTHNHYDHLDDETLSRLWARFRPRVIAPLGNDTVIRGYDSDVRVTTLDWSGSVDLGGVTAHLTPANHWSARGLNDRRMALWGGYALATSEGLVYLAGDTGYGDGSLFRDIRARFGAPRLAALPIGAYEPRWFMRAQHMNPTDAVAAFGALDAESAIGVHWGTFHLTNERVDQPETDLAAALSEAGIDPSRFRAFRPGEVWQAPREQPTAS